MELNLQRIARMKWNQFSTMILKKISYHNVHHFPGLYIEKGFLKVKISILLLQLY